MITVNQVGKMSVSLSNGQHQIMADVAKELGGDDEALNPHEIVEAALGACTAQTLELYAKRKNWDLTNLQIQVKIIHEGADSLIDTSISFGDQVTEEMKQRLMEIAKKCPIHKLLQSNIKIETHEK